MPGELLTDPEWDPITLISSSEPLPELEWTRTADFARLFTSESTKQAIGVSNSTVESIILLNEAGGYGAFVEYCVIHRLTQDPTRTQLLLCIAIGALQSFIQSNITGPPLPFDPVTELLPQAVSKDADLTGQIQKDSLLTLTVDGESPYHLTPNALLLVLAKTIVNRSTLSPDGDNVAILWWRVRINFLHQRILSGATATLYNSIYEDLKKLSQHVTKYDNLVQAKFLIEKARIDTYFGYDAKALKGLEEAARLTGLKYALTGVMGKRTKFQEKEISQLVVLAKSAEQAEESGTTKPNKLALNDDTLLESISFNKTTEVKDENNLPPELASLDPGDQPALHPLDAAILLLLTETIKNTNAESGITREEMLPYAERVLSHSTNWEVYTLGLLVRSRIESYKSRTVERGVLQLQVVVDQIIAETTSAQNASGDSNGVSTFLPRPKQEESASVQERLQYIHQLSTPTRWELEAELASKWAHLGGLRTALEIYERLQMWPEVALCWAATDQEDKACDIIRRQLFEEDMQTEKSPLPSDAPRLWCILGDIEGKPEHYERAWVVGNSRYSRAQRSLGRYYFSRKEYRKSATAYAISLKVNPLNHQTWFALGCCWLELEHWNGAVEAFGRAVSLDDTDAEAWSNLATALLNREITINEADATKVQKLRLDDEEVDSEENTMVVDKEKNKRDALNALKRAAQLKNDSWRIWQNFLVVAASVNPPAFNDVVIAMKKIIELRKEKEGETAVDVEILERLVQHIIAQDLESDAPTGYDPSKPGITKAAVELVDKDVVPLITTNHRLWKIVARLALWRKRPKQALEAHEKAWRAVNSRPGITEATEKEWDELVEESLEMADAYESLGPMERTEGLGAGEMVAKDWRFKARSLLRGAKAKGKGNWEGTKGWDRLEERLEGLKE